MTQEYSEVVRPLLTGRQFASDVPDGFEVRVNGHLWFGQIEFSVDEGWLTYYDYDDEPCETVHGIVEIVRKK